MEKIDNPFAGLDNYYCFGCCPDNQYGLQMEFYEDGEEIVSLWEPKKQFQGYHAVLHGGIQSTLIDEIASWLVRTKLKSSGMTAKLEVKFKKPVLMNEGKLTLRAKLLETRRNLAYINVKLLNSKDELCSEGGVVFFLLPQETINEALK